MAVGARQRLPAIVVGLGFASLLMDVSSEAIHSILPLFVTGTLGAAATWVGLIDGLGRGLALATRWISGTASDRDRRRVPWILAGYGLAAASKPLFGMAPNVAWIVLARLLDRLGKGLRGAPRDALITEITPPGRWGDALGFRRSLDLVGAALGPVLALALLAAGSDLRDVLLYAAIPAGLALATLLVTFRRHRVEDAGGTAATTDPPATRPAGEAFRWLVATGVLLSLARLGLAFLILRASDIGWSTRWVPLIPLLATLIQAGLARPIGRLADGGRAGMSFGLGALALAGAHALLAFIPGVTGVLPVAVALWGLHVGLTDVPLLARVARTAPEGQRGARYGVYGVATGIAVLAAGLMAGTLWDMVGPHAPFVVGCGLALISTVPAAIAARATAPPARVSLS